jgi:hypothetical protein
MWWASSPNDRPIAFWYSATPVNQSIAPRLRATMYVIG